MVDMLPLTAEFEEYCRDESRSVGEASSISFPASEQDVRDVLRGIQDSAREAGRTPEPVTVQGARTGLAAGAVPHGGHVMNLSRMNRVLGLDLADDGCFSVRVQPGVILSELRKYLSRREFPCRDWSDESLATLEALSSAPAQMFPTDPTETSAALGGMAACNASGARSYGYGPMRPHVRGLRIVLADGDVVALERSQVMAQGLNLDLPCESGRVISLTLPSYQMPATKNASGYYVAPDMDAIDLFIGSDGTLGVITELTLDLMPAPVVTWGVNCFFESEAAALDFTVAARQSLSCACALEYFDAGALSILRRQRSNTQAFAALPAVDERFDACVFVELACANEDEALAELAHAGELMERVGASEADTWVGRTDVDRECQRFFRHAVPESVNMLIDERRRTSPGITKLGSDMSVPDDRLHDVVALYRATLAEAGLESATWGHIGNNHLHVNVLPRDAEDFVAGKKLFLGWAAQVTAMGGAVSAEHGVGKIKRDFLAVMYGEEHVAEMAALKRTLDPACQLGRGNLFAAEVAEAAEPACPAAVADAASPALGSSRRKGGE